MTVQFAAFVRNVNQGQRGHPSTADLIGAFIDARCSTATPFQSNGTLVVEADSIDVVESASLHLAERSGIERDVFALPLAELAEIVETSTAEPIARAELTLHRGRIIDIESPHVIREAAHRRCTFVASGEGWVVTVNERDRESNATPVLERLTGGLATSRGLTTIVRLLERFG